MIAFWAVLLFAPSVFVTLTLLLALWVASVIHQPTYWVLVVVQVGFMGCVGAAAIAFRVFGPK